jgi:hypothetical protein
MVSLHTVRFNFFQGKFELKAIQKKGMEKRLKEALPQLAKELSFTEEKISGTDFYYTDGQAVGACLKLWIENGKSQTSVFFFPSGDYFATLFLHEKDKNVLDAWVTQLRQRDSSYRT